MGTLCSNVIFQTVLGPPFSGAVPAIKFQLNSKTRVRGIWVRKIRVPPRYKLGGGMMNDLTGDLTGIQRGTKFS